MWISNLMWTWLESVRYHVQSEQIFWKIIIILLLVIFVMWLWAVPSTIIINQLNRRLCVYRPFRFWGSRQLHARKCGETDEFKIAQSHLLTIAHYNRCTLISMKIKWNYSDILFKAIFSIRIYSHRTVTYEAYSLKMRNQTRKICWKVAMENIFTA